MATSSTNEDSSWAEVVQKDIKWMVTAMLNDLRRSKDADLFESPVVEAYPEIRDSYLQVISEPMDFARIEQKMNGYTSAKEVQRDFKLIFQNCIRFNGESSEYGVIAQAYLDRLDELFQSVILGKRCRKRSRIRYDKVQNRYDGIQLGQHQRSKAPAKKQKQNQNPQLGRQLKEANAKIKNLEKEVAARDRRIRELEAQLAARQHQEEPASDVPQSPQQPEEVEDGACRVCRRDSDYSALVMCDYCEDEFHMHCLDPPLTSAPSGRWQCAECRSLVPLSIVKEEDN